jgi:hypothetical protein
MSMCGKWGQDFLRGVLESHEPLSRPFLKQGNALRTIRDVPTRQHARAALSREFAAGACTLLPAKRHLRTPVFVLPPCPAMR